jgi:hypothetical protein
MFCFRISLTPKSPLFLDRQTLVHLTIY